MENEDANEFHFDQKNYFARFKFNEDEQQTRHVSKHIRHALEYFVDDLQRNRDKTIEYFLNEQPVQDIFLSIAQLLSCTDERLVNIFISNFFLHGFLLFIVVFVVIVPM